MAESPSSERVRRTCKGRVVTCRAGRAEGLGSHNVVRCIPTIHFNQKQRPSRQSVFRILLGEEWFR